MPSLGWLGLGLVVLAALASIGLVLRAPSVPGLDLANYRETLDLTSDQVPWLIASETHEIDFGTVAAAKHLGHGWADAETLADGTSLAWGLAPQSALTFEVLEPSDRILRARVWPARQPGKRRQKVSFELNGERVGSRRLDRGPQTLRIELPGSAQVRGKNRLILRYRWHRKVIPADAAPRRLAVAWEVLTLGDSGGWPISKPAVEPGTLTLPYGTAISFFIRSPGDSVLTFGDLDLGDSRGHLRVTSRSDGGGFEEHDVSRGLKSSPIPLLADEDQLLQMTLTAVWGRGSSPLAGITVRGLELRSRRPIDQAGLAPRPATSPSVAEPSPGVARPNVIVYLVDTLRADHLGCYGYSRATSPKIDAFAEEATLYEKTMAQSAWTRSAVASLMTGRVPPAHGVMNRDDALADDAVTLAEIMRQTGYATAGFVTNGNVGEPFGFAQGFSDFRLLGLKDQGTRYTSAGELTDEALRWIDKHSDEPFFLYLHAMEPHTPYAPNEETRKLLAPGVVPRPLDAAVRQAMVDRGDLPPDSQPVLGSVAWIQALIGGLITPDPRDTAAMVALYDAEIRSVDQAFGQLLDALRERDLYENSLIVFLSDHGEEFYDHGDWSHGRTLYQEQLAIPLVVRFPGAGRPRGQRQAELAAQIDLLPTVVDLLGLERPTELHGQSLLTPPDPGRTAYSHLELDTRSGESFRVGRYKLICDPCRLYDLASDPGESEDLAAELPVRSSYLRALISRFGEHDAPSIAPAIDLDPALTRQLRALGYL